MAIPLKPSLKLIAERAGVSIMTVSRILRNCPNHDPHTRERVLQIAKELDYKKNPFVSALMANIRHNKPTNIRSSIAFIQSEDQPYLSGANKTRLLGGIFDSAANNGFDVEVFSLNKDGMTPLRLIKILQARGYRGLILEPFLSPSGFLDLDLSTFAGISIANPLTQPGFNNVEPDYLTGLLVAVEKIRETGYKRIGFVSEKVEDSNSRNRRISAFVISKLKLDKHNRIPILWEISNADKMKRKLDLWIQNHKPEVVLTSAKSIPDCLSELGYKIPEDLGFANLELSDDIGLHAGTHSNWYEIGTIAASKVVESIITNNFGPLSNPNTTLVSPVWADGNSLHQRFATTA